MVSSVSTGRDESNGTCVEVKGHLGVLPLLHSRTQVSLPVPTLRTHNQLLIPVLGDLILSGLKHLMNVVHKNSFRHMHTHKN